jgi:nitroreductase/NAD-dependent dihydropyrimidine dehydrogenase PreA subunit
MHEDRELVDRVKRDILYGHDIAPPSVDPEKCRGCGDCVQVCPSMVFELREHRSEVVRGWRCIACGHCWAVCAEEAVTQNEATTRTGPRPGPGPAVTPEDLQLLIRERRSTRIFRDEPVSREQLLTIVEAGRYVPTGSNRQDVNYIILSDREKVGELRVFVEGFLGKMSKALENPALSLFLRMRYGRLNVDVLRYYAAGYGAYRDIPDERRRQIVYFPLPFGPAVIIAHAQAFDATAPANCSMALYACSLMAHSLGLASCFVGFVPTVVNMDKRARRRLGVPKDNQVYGAIVLGHPGVEYRRLVERKPRGIVWL